MASEAITRNDLKAILNEILPQDHYIQSWESIGDVYWGTGTWTVPDDGFLLIYANPSTAPWYYRISDSGVPDGGWSHRLGSNYAVSQSYVCFVKKGMVLKDHSKNNISSINAYYFKFTLKNTLPSSIVKGFWTPKIYDYETAKGSFTTDSGRYYDIAGGAIRIFCFNQQASSAFSFSTMLQIRGDAMNGYTIVGGTLYAAGATNSLGDRTIQASSTGVYIRPNYTGTINAGWWSGFFVGIKNDWF